MRRVMLYILPFGLSTFDKNCLKVILVQLQDLVQFIFKKNISLLLIKRQHNITSFDSMTFHFLHVHSTLSINRNINQDLC